MGLPPHATTLSAASLVCLLTTLCTARPSIFIITPNVFHLEEDESVSVIGSQLPGGRTTVTLYLQHLPGGQAYGHQTKELRDDVPLLLTMKVDKAKLAATPRQPGQPAYIRVTARANKRGLGLPKHTDVLVSLAGGHVFVQTDKPVYTPRETLYIRVFTTDEDTKAVSRSVRIEIKNPQDITVKRLDGQTEAGILSDSYTLPPIPFFGSWSIHIKHGYNWERSETVKFEVKEYVLPTYQVKITGVKDYIVSTTQRISAVIEAKYSFNHYVTGTASVQFRIVQGDRSYLVDFKRTTLNAGSALVALDIAKLKQAGKRFQFPDVKGAHLEVDAVVMETSSGHTERAVVRHTTFVESPYVISFGSTPSHFHPGLPFTLKVDVRHVNGEPAANLPVTFTAVGLQNAADRTPTRLLGRDADALNRLTDARGRMVTAINTDSGHRIVRVTVQTTNPSAELASHQPVVVNDWTNYQSTSQLLISEKRQESGVDKFQFEVIVTKATEAGKVNYMAISRGKIVEQGVSVRDGGSTVTTIDMPVTAAMVPSVRLVAWYTKPDGEVIADSTVIDVRRKCREEVSLNIVEDEPVGGYLPGSTLTLRVTAALNAKVALLVVDKAVYFVNKQDVLTPKKMFDQLESRDLGCGGGGGANAQQVFMSAGLSVISNARSVTTLPRQQETCAEQNNGKRKRRSTPETVPDPTDCCALGTAHAKNHTQNTSKSDGQSICMSKGHNLPYSTTCVNSFFRCCRNTSDQMYRTRNPQLFSSARSIGEALHEDGFEFDLSKDAEYPLRRRFPESWLFESVNVDGLTGTKDVSITLKDSITTWVFQAVAMSPSKGMCVAPPYNVTARKLAFIHLDLPYSVIKGEQIEVKVTAFNMLQGDIRASVQLGHAEGVCSSAVKDGWTKRKIISIPGLGSTTVTWPIVALQVGPLPIRVRIYSIAGREMVEKIMTVKHGGAEKRLFLSGTIDPQAVTISQGKAGVNAHNGSVVTESWTPPNKHILRVNLRLPPEAIATSAVATLGVMGETMGPVVAEVLKSSQSWIKLPRGCGEQTMMTLGPTIFAARYLKETGQMTDALERSTYDTIERGVKRMYRYRHANGGFSVWRGRNPGYWLTAFVVKTLSQARAFVQDDPSGVICSGSLMLLTGQDADGSFLDPVGIVHHTDLKGQLHRSGKDALSASILIGLKESNCVNQQLTAAIRRGRTYLEGVYTQLTVPYEVAMVTYALALTGSQYKEAANRKLRDLSRYSRVRNHRYWPQKANEAAPEGQEWRQRKASAVDIETAGYALLTQLTLGHTNYSYSIAAWLLAQRTSGAGFKSTQDTVIALQALTEYSIKTQRNDLHFDVSVTATRKTISFSPKLREDNRLLLQSTEVTRAVGGDLVLEAEGTGVGAYQLEVVYNTNLPDTAACLFNLTVTANPPEPGDIGIAAPAYNARAAAAGAEDPGNLLLIKSCARLLKEGETNMAMMDVGLHTGFAPDHDSLKLLVEDQVVDHFEVTSRSVIFYLEKITNEKPVCVQFLARYTNSVINMKPVGVKVYDYYKPDEVSCETFYHPDGLNSRLNSHCEGEICSCLVSCPTCYGFEPGYESPPTTEELWGLACNKHDYVYVIEALEVLTGLVTTRIQATIKRVVKKGIDETAAIGTRIDFIMDISCYCQAGFIITPGKPYVVMGQDPDGVHDINEVKTYSIDGYTFVSPRFNRPRDGSKQDDTIKKFRKFLRVLGRDGCGV